MVISTNEMGENKMKTLYYIEFSNGEILEGLTGKELQEQKDAPGKIIITWGLIK